MQRIFRKKFIK